jgi:NADH dehydrogenase
MDLNTHIPKASYKRIVILGAGFAGLKIARKLQGSRYQVVLIDRNNYHQFQPLFYQVATSGLEPASICFPLRRIFQLSEEIYIRIAVVERVEAEKNRVHTNIGILDYDYLVIAAGCDTNFFGNENIIRHALPMKNVAEALSLRNHILQGFENYANDETKNEKYLNIVIVGGGPTGVELAGTLAEMRNHILPKDYPEVDFSMLNIIIIDSGERVLSGFSEKSSRKAREYLLKLGVKVQLNTHVNDYDGEHAILDDGSKVNTNTLIWAAGVIGARIEGLHQNCIAKGNRFRVNHINLVEGYNDIFAVGDIAYQTELEFPHGYPQVAQVAIQQGKNVGRNFLRMLKNKKMEHFSYHDLGSMATVGRNKAVVEISHVKVYGFAAWFVWMIVHLLSLIGVKNKIIIFINWIWNYFTYDQNLRLIIKQKPARP